MRTSRSVVSLGQRLRMSSRSVARRASGAAVVFAGGFAESGERGEGLQAEIHATAEEYDIAILGPNTAGHIIPHRNLFSSFVPGFDDIESGNVAIAAQSGGVGGDGYVPAGPRGYGVAGMYGLGNRVNTDFDDVVPMLDDDPETDAIALHIEGTNKIDAVIEAVADAKTPVVALKSGNKMAEFVQAHTAAPIQEYGRYERAFTDAGAVMARHHDRTARRESCLANVRRPMARTSDS